MMSSSSSSSVSPSFVWVVVFRGGHVEEVSSHCGYAAERSVAHKGVWYVVRKS